MLRLAVEAYANLSDLIFVNDVIAFEKRMQPSDHSALYSLHVPSMT